MRNFLLVPAILSLAILVVSGCSFENRGAQADLNDFYISEISVTVDEGVDLQSLQPQEAEDLMKNPPLLAAMLEDAIQEQTADLPAGTRPAKMSVVLQELRVAQLGDRTLGAVGEMSGSVEVSDTETGEILAMTSIVGRDGEKDEVLDSIGGVFAVMVVAPVAVLLNSVDEEASAELQAVVDSFAENVGQWLGA